MKLIRLLLLLGLVAGSSGCVGWRRVSPPAPAAHAPLRQGVMRVTRARGSPVELHSVVVSADSVIGWRAREPRAGERLALHRSEVWELERQGLDFMRTTLALLAFGAAVLLMAVSNAS